MRCTPSKTNGNSYGYFDDSHREYVITRPNTPTSWSNYLGSTEYGAIITNNAGGYSFYKSAATGRFLRLRFNSVPLDQPGRYFYLRDNDNQDYWSSSWQPVGKSLAEYQSECRHGTAYTTIKSSYDQIETESTYFVPLNQHFEYWVLKVSNRSDRVRDLSIFTYAEFASHWHVLQDLINLQYTLYTVKADKVGDIFEVKSQHHLPSEPVLPEDKESHSFNAWMSLRGAAIESYDFQRERFLGSAYHTYQNPQAVAEGQCSNSLAHGDTACGALQSRIQLQPGETKDIVVMLGVGKAQEAQAIVDEFGSVPKAEIELRKVKGHWHGLLGNFQVKSPDEDLNHMVNVWNAYNGLITYSWSRSASLVYNGERDGLGYRDTVQDILGVLSSIPEEAGERLSLMISGQYSNGGAKPVVNPFNHHPGKETPIADREFRSDDSLWLFFTVPAYVAETGDEGYLEKVIPYADEGEDTVLGHLKRALEFSIRNSGKHGLPCGLAADWNDCLCLGNQGESVFAAFQLRYGLRVYGDLCDRYGFEHEAQWAREQLRILDENLQDHAWDGEWFVRAFTEAGETIGTHRNEEGTIFLNAQCWAVISGLATPAQEKKIMQDVYEKLRTDFGLMLCSPAFVKTCMTQVRAVLFNQGMKENAGIFFHPQSWAVMAECMLGNGDRAYEYYRAYMPAAYNDRADLRVSEPYVHAQSAHATYSRQFGKSSLPWLSGTASWSYYVGTQYILGIRPELDGLRIDPCVPREWTEFKVKRNWRGKELCISFRNPRKINRGVKSIILNGIELKKPLIAFDNLNDINEISVEMG